MSVEIESVSSFFKKVNSFKQEKRRIDYFNKNLTAAAKTILVGNFNPKIDLKMPSGAPPYEPNEDAEHNEKLYEKMGRFMPSGQHQWAREKMFIDFLQSVPPEDAKVIIAHKDKKLTEMYPNINKEFISKVCPEVLG
tara:strand:- start:59 stop:469 length:411 start_codon:yes stop_codon:yes gene_type:complete